MGLIDSSGETPSTNLHGEEGMNNWGKGCVAVGGKDGGKAPDEVGDPGMVLVIQHLRDCGKMLVLIPRSMRNK